MKNAWYSPGATRIFGPVVGGGTLTTGLTVTITCDEAGFPLLSVAVRVKLYVPWIRPVTAVVSKPAEAITGVLGPLVEVHWVVLMVAPPLPLAVPDKLTVLTGSVIDKALPAFTVGGAIASTVIITVEVLG